MTPARLLDREASDFIDGDWISIAGDEIVSTNPANPDETLWRGAPALAHVDRAVAAARRAFPAWAALSFDERAIYLRRWQEVTSRSIDRLAGVICDESGKTMVEARAEASALAAKVDITLDPSGSIQRAAGFNVPISSARRGECRFRPHGVMAILGPFNFPAHLANGHWVPALAMGNSIVFKPSEKTPAIGQLLTELWLEVGLPHGVFNLVHGAAEIAARLVNHDDINGVLFTGSWPVGRKILEANLDRPGRMIALEMGGNNATVVMSDAHLRQAVLECVRAGFATTGQRCTCTRRIIVHGPIAERFVRAFVSAAKAITVGPGRSEPAPFCGPLINDDAVRRVLEFQRELQARGGRVLLEAIRPPNMRGHFITPGIVQVARFELEHDCEVFGPLVQVSICRDLDDAIAQANASRYGLAASIFTTDDDAAQRFLCECRAGCVNVNTGTAGASSKLPFGGLGHSGNHRPAGAFSVDYCAYPVASMIETSSDAAIPTGMSFNDDWLAE